MPFFEKEDFIMSTVFDKFRQFRLTADEADYDCREGCFMRLYRNTDKAEYEQWLNLLVLDGFEILQQTDINGNLYTCLTGDVVINAFYTPCDGILRVAASENKRVPCFEAQECEGKGETAFYAFENDQSLIDCGMCLLIEDEDIESALNCIVENKGEYHSIVPLTGQIKSHRDKYC